MLPTPGPSADGLFSALLPGEIRPLAPIRLDGVANRLLKVPGLAFRPRLLERSVIHGGTCSSDIGTPAVFAARAPAQHAALARSFDRRIQPYRFERIAAQVKGPGIILKATQQFSVHLKRLERP